MYRQNRYSRTSVKLNQSTEGETIEQKIERIVNNNEAITDGAPIIYTERKEGVQAGYDIRSDRFDIAIDATDKITKSHRAKRQSTIDERAKALKDLKDKENGNNQENNGGTESTRGQGSQGGNTTE